MCFNFKKKLVYQLVKVSALYFLSDRCSATSVIAVSALNFKVQGYLISINPAKFTTKSSS